jgi:secreted trypsin-like serine protease
MNGSRFGAIALLLSVFALNGCTQESADEPAEKSDKSEQDIYYGQSAASNLAVVELYRNGGSWCTGFFISSRHIITAAHCTDAYYGSQWYQVKAKTGYTSFANIRDSYRADNWILALETHHPSWSFSSPTANADIAILTLPASAAAPSWQAKHLLSTTQPYVGQKLSIWGWGRRTEYDTQPSHDLLTAWGNDQVTVGSVDWNGSATRFTAVVDNYARTCDGDSGGPATRYTNGNYVAVGAHRGSNNPPPAHCATWGSTMYWASIADKTTWIRNVVAGAGIYCGYYADYMKCF